MERSGTGERGAVAALALAMLLASLGTSIANIALPAIAPDFGAGFGQVRWVVIAYLAALTVFSVIAGRSGDRFGQRRMLVAGLAVFAVASAVAAAAPGLEALVAARAVQGAGAAFMMVLTIALVREAAGEARIGRTMGLLGTMSAIGTALGPSLGGVLIATGGWRAVFWVLVPGAVAALALVQRLVPEGRGARAEQGAEGGAIPVRALAANFLVAAVMMTTLIVGPFYLGLGLGLGEAAVGLVMSVGPVISILTGVPSGRLVDRLGAGRVLVLGLGAMAAGAFGLVILPGALGVAGYVAAIAVLTPGYQLFQAANNTAVMAGVPVARRGRVSGLLGLARNLGLIAGASVMGAVFAAGAGTGVLEAAGAEAVARGMRWSFAVAGGLMGLALAITRGKAR